MNAFAAGNSAKLSKILATQKRRIKFQTSTPLSDGVSEKSLADRSVTEYDRPVPHFFHALHAHVPDEGCGAVDAA